MYKYVLMDLERSIKSGITTFWKKSEIGYTTMITKAGLYSEEKAKEISESDLDNRTIAIRKDVIDNIL